MLLCNFPHQSLRGLIFKNTSPSECGLRLVTIGLILSPSSASDHNARLLGGSSTCKAGFLNALNEQSLHFFVPVFEDFLSKIVQSCAQSGAPARCIPKTCSYSPFFTNGKGYIFGYRLGIGWGIGGNGWHFYNKKP